MTKAQIESALLAAAGSYTGASVPTQPKAVREHMIASKLMTEAGNLTSFGVDCRRGVMLRLEDQAFG